MITYFLSILFANKSGFSAYLLYFLFFFFLSEASFLKDLLFFIEFLPCFCLSSEWLVSFRYEGHAETEYPKALQSSQPSKLSTKIHCWHFYMHITTIPNIKSFQEECWWAIRWDGDDRKLMIKQHTLKGPLLPLLIILCVCLRVLYCYPSQQHHRSTTVPRLSQQSLQRIAWPIWPISF